MANSNKKKIAMHVQKKNLRCSFKRLNVDQSLKKYNKS